MKKLLLGTLGMAMAATSMAAEPATSYPTSASVDIKAQFTVTNDMMQDGGIKIVVDGGSNEILFKGANPVNVNGMNNSEINTALNAAVKAPKVTLQTYNGNVIDTSMVKVAIVGADKATVGAVPAGRWQALENIASNYVGYVFTQVDINGGKAPNSDAIGAKVAHVGEGELKFTLEANSTKSNGELVGTYQDGGKFWAKIEG